MSYKYLQTLDRRIYLKMKTIAESRGITVQELVRVKLIPDFLFGPPAISPRLVKKMLKAGMFKNGSRKVSGNGRLPKTA